MSARTLVLGLLTAATILSATSSIAGPWIPGPGEHYNEFSGDFGSTQVFYDTSGTKQFFDHGGVREETSIVSYNEFGWKRRIGIAFTVPIVSRTAKIDDPLRVERNNTGIADLTFSFNASILTGATALSFEAQWVGPSGYDRDDAPALGTGQQNVGGLLHFGTGFAERFFVQASGGYQYRFDDPADRVGGSADVGFWLTNSVLLSGRAAGSQTVGADSVLQESRNLVVGPEVRYRFDDELDLFAGSQHTAAGKNVVHFNRYYVGLAVKRTALNRLQGYLGGKRRS